MSGAPVLSRRAALRSAVAGALGALCPLPGDAQGAPGFTDAAATAFDADWLTARAADLARQPHRARPRIPAAWAALDYDQYRMMWFDPRRAIWSDTDAPFRVDLLHPGLFYHHPVEINVVTGGMARPLRFDRALFAQTDQLPDLPDGPGLGYSGLRLRAPLERPDIFTECAVFQGASYFRAIGTGLSYGLSARGLAIGTASARGEEFPDFTRFWLETPEPGQTHVTLHALLESESVTGAYRFDITPGAQTRMQVSAQVFARHDVPHLGIAPLTSMFLFDPTNRAGHDDFRPRVHDSGTLAIHNGAGEALARPLRNPRRLEISAFVDHGPRGFGLMQRPRALAAYRDFEARYHARPSLWITPGEDWGAGALELVEIPADQEIYDNIVAYWRPAEGLAAGDMLRVSYAMHWGAEDAPDTGLARIAHTAIGQEPGAPGTSRIVIDYADHPAISGPLAGLSPRLSAAQGQVSEPVLHRDPVTGAFRVSFTVALPEDSQSELRLELRDTGGAALAETWLYRLDPRDRRP